MRSLGKELSSETRALLKALAELLKACSASTLLIEVLQLGSWDRCELWSESSERGEQLALQLGASLRKKSAPSHEFYIMRVYPRVRRLETLPDPPLRRIRICRARSFTG